MFSTFESLLSISFKVVVGLTAVFVIVFYYLCYIWADMHKKHQRVEIALMTTGVYSFLFFGAGCGAALLFSLLGSIIMGVINLGR